MFGRRVPPRVILVLSLVLAVLCAVPAFRYGQAGNWLAALLWGAVAVWFAVDAIRAYGWTRGR
ncbi:hypothetical protein [Deinococcus sp. YIM 77859]|uniref:hypothetical protein n=1 Tax=Deinococcus sp. YIM 77859 TaxID=1540221 RepID=UPI0005502BBE|nr:hypothetical protein [Deinococcus sp. YIM 77859]